MPVKYGSDSSGFMKNVPYDGRVAKSDGKGKWWEGMDPVDLYGPVHTSKNYKVSDSDAFTRQFLWRTQDLYSKYDLDLLYFDDALFYDYDLGVWLGMPDQARTIAADYYNKSNNRHEGKTNVVMNIKSGRIKDSSELHSLPAEWEKAIVRDYELTSSQTISPYPWQSDYSLGEWHYLRGMPIAGAEFVIPLLINVVSRNGNLLLNVPQHGDGHLDAISIQTCRDVGDWLRINGEAVYGSRPFELPSENDIRFTRKSAWVYALALKWPSCRFLHLRSLRKGGSTLGIITKVELLGNSGSVPFIQDSAGLTIDCHGLSVGKYAGVFKITQNKSLVNDDDPGVFYYGWHHSCNRSKGDYNNDIHYSDKPGEFCVFDFSGAGVEWLASGVPGMGHADIYLDGVRQSASGKNFPESKLQQIVYENHQLKAGKHSLKIVNIGNALISIDAFRVYPGLNPEDQTKSDTGLNR